WKARRRGRKIGLDLLERRSHLGGDLLGEDDADGAVQLVDVAERRDACAVLRDAGAVAQGRLAGGAGGGGAPREAMAHLAFTLPEVAFASLSTSPCASRVRRRSPGFAWAASRSTAPLAPYVML